MTIILAQNHHFRYQLLLLVPAFLAIILHRSHHSFFLRKIASPRCFLKYVRCIHPHYRILEYAFWGTADSAIVMPVDAIAAGECKRLFSTFDRTLVHARPPRHCALLNRAVVHAELQVSGCIILRFVPVGWVVR